MSRIHVTPHTDGWAVFFESSPTDEIELLDPLGSEFNPYIFETRRGAEKFIIGLSALLIPPFTILFHNKYGSIVERITKK